MKWLHISDLHFGKTVNGSFDSMWEKLPDIKAEIGRVDYLFITGDLRYGHEIGSGYPQEVEKSIQTVQRAFRIEPENTFIVPGNHDVNQGANDAEKDALRKDIESAKEFYQKQRTGGCIPKIYLRRLKKRKRDFYSLRERLSPNGEVKEELHFCVQRDDYNIVGLDTAIVSGTNENESGKLILDMSRVKKVFKGIDQHKPTIVLAHHDPRELNQTEQRSLENLFSDCNVILYLCGHSHFVKVESSKDRVTTIFTAGTFQEPEPGKSYDFPDMDVLVGEVNPNETGEYAGYVKAYRWDYRVERWFLDPAFSCRSEAQYYSTDGIYYFPRREKSLASSSQNLESRYMRYLTDVCGKADLHGSHPQNRNARLSDIFISPHFQATDYNLETERLRTAPSGLPLATVLQDTHDTNDVPLKRLLNHTPLRAVILSNPGGGKSTLLKWIAQDQAGKKADRCWLPIWLRASDFRSHEEQQVDNGHDFPAFLRAAVKFAGQQAGLDEESDDTSDYGAMSFLELVEEHTRKGTALFLIDGLDEILDAKLRESLFYRLKSFLTEYNKANLILTLRDSGFSNLKDWGKWNENDNRWELCEDLKDFSVYRLASLVKDDVRGLCKKWFVADGDSEDEGLRLAEAIIRQKHTASLAENPLMLTLMLLVRENHEGWLPDTPVSLYEAASSLLLERWAAGTQLRCPLDLEETRYQLSFIAFSLRGTYEVSKSDLIALLERIREGREYLVFRNRDVSEDDFLRLIDDKNALLLWSGPEKAVYGFQHRVFWEYFSAYAVDRHCYEDYHQGERPLAPFLDRLWEPGTATIMPGTAEILLLTAAMDPISSQMLAHDLTELLKKESLESDRYLPLKGLLLRFLTEEVRLDYNTVWEILETAFKKGMTPNDPVVVYRILHGRYRENLRAFFIHHGEEFHSHHGGGAYWMTLMDILEGSNAELQNVWLYYWNHIHDNPLNALSALSTAIWMNTDFLGAKASEIYPGLPELDPGKSIREMLLPDNSAERVHLVDSLLNIALRKEPTLSWHALRALHQGFITNPGDFLRGEDFPRYLRACLSYMNLTHELPLLSWDLIVTILPVLCREYADDFQDAYLTVEAIGLICMEFESRLEENRCEGGEYERLLSFFVLALFGHTNCDELKRILRLILREQETLLEQGQAGAVFFEATFQFAECLDEVFLGNRYEDDEGDKWWKNTLDDFDDKDTSIIEPKPITPYEESLSQFLESCIFHILCPVFQYVQRSGDRKHIGRIMYCPSLQVRFQQPGIKENFDVGKAIRVMQDYSA